jgi:hypothetical protein
MVHAMANSCWGFTFSGSTGGGGRHWHPVVKRRCGNWARIFLQEMWGALLEGVACLSAWGPQSCSQNKHSGDWGCHEEVCLCSLKVSHWAAACVWVKEGAPLGAHSLGS